MINEHEPSKEKAKVSYNLLFTHREHRLLRELADATGLPMSSCIRLLIVQAHRTLVDEREHTI